MLQTMTAQHRHDTRRQRVFPFFTVKGLTTKRARRANQRAVKLLTATTKAATKAAVKTTRTLAREAAASLPTPAATPATKAPGRFLVQDSVRVHVIVRGRGRPVVLIHGNGTMAQDFEICGLIDRLAENYRVIAIDRPGFGHSTRPRYCTWTAQVQARLVHRVLEQLGVEKPLVVGHSWGTLVALALAADGLRELRGLVLLAGYYYPSRRADVMLSKVLANPWLGDAARAMVPKALTRTMAAQAFRHVFQPQSVPVRFTRQFPVEIAMGDTQLRASTEDAATMNAAATLLQRRYPELALPVAILAGDADTLVDLDEQARRLYAEVPGSTLKILPGQGHMLQYGARAAILRAIERLMPPTGKGRMG